MTINAFKSKVLDVMREEEFQQACNRKVLKIVNEYTYSGTIISNSDNITTDFKQAIQGKSPHQ